MCLTHQTNDSKNFLYALGVILFLTRTNMIYSTLTYGSKVYHQHKEAVIDLYIEAFYEDKSQELLRQNVGSYFDTIIAQGFAIFSLDNHRINGVMLCASPEMDKHMPEDISSSIDKNKSLYIAEVFVRQSSRGKGIGKQLFNALFELTADNYKHYIIRVLSHNTAAIKLYQKCLFLPQCTIVERKMDFNQNKMVLKKLYLTRTIE